MWSVDFFHQSNILSIITPVNACNWSLSVIADSNTSLTLPIIYPKINEIISKFHKQEISTFLVTNGQYPEQIEKLEPVTQLYLSVDAPNKESLKEIDKPIFSDYWERLNQSLEILSRKKHRTCIRITLIKGLNDNKPKEFAKAIKKGNPDFIEAKAYMFVGASRERLKKENMPLHEEVVEFSKELNKELPEYDIVSEHIPSRVVLLAKKNFKKQGKWNTWIDFNKFFKQIKEDKEVKGYNKETPETGISGKRTKDLTKITEIENF